MAAVVCVGGGGRGGGGCMVGQKGMNLFNLRVKRFDWRCSLAAEGGRRRRQRTIERSVASGVFQRGELGEEGRGWRCV
jgi:hypothetical protein